MWNDKVEATPKVGPSWLVPASFVLLAAVGFLLGLAYGQFQ